MKQVLKFILFLFVVSCSPRSHIIDNRTNEQGNVSETIVHNSGQENPTDVQMREAPHELDPSSQDEDSKDENLSENSNDSETDSPFEEENNDMANHDNNTESSLSMVEILILTHF